MKGTHLLRGTRSRAPCGGRTEEGPGATVDRKCIHQLPEPVDPEGGLGAGEGVLYR